MKTYKQLVENVATSEFVRAAERFNNHPIFNDKQKFKSSNDIELTLGKIGFNISINDYGTLADDADKIRKEAQYKDTKGKYKTTNEVELGSFDRMPIKKGYATLKYTLTFHDDGGYGKSYFTIQAKIWHK